MTNEQNVTSQISNALDYLVELSINLGHPVTWYEFRDDSNVDANLLKAKLGFPVNIENQVKDAYREYIKTHPQAKPVTKATPRQERKAAKVIQRSGYNGDLQELTIKLMSKRWAPMMELCENGYRAYSLNCADFLLEILSDIAEAAGGILPDMYLIEALSCSQLNSPCYQYFYTKLGLRETWQEQLNNYRDRLKRAPHLIKQPKRWSYQPTTPTEELIKKLQNKSWAKTMRSRGEKGHPLTNEICHEILSDITEENGGYLPSWRQLADVRAKLHIPSETAFKTRVGPRKFWKQQLEHYRQEYCAERKFHTITEVSE